MTTRWRPTSKALFSGLFWTSEHQLERMTSYYTGTGDVTLSKLASTWESKPLHFAFEIAIYQHQNRIFSQKCSFDQNETAIELMVENRVWANENSDSGWKWCLPKWKLVFCGKLWFPKTKILFMQRTSKRSSFIISPDSIGSCNKPNSKISNMWILNCCVALRPP